jgi:hypothetical protein
LLIPNRPASISSKKKRKSQKPRLYFLRLTIRIKIKWSCCISARHRIYKYEIYLNKLVEIDEFTLSKNVMRQLGFAAWFEQDDKSAGSKKKVQEPSI